MRLPRRDGLNIVPFIDIMLVLLCIVLSVSTFIAQGLIKVDLPSSKTATKSDEIKEITIKVDKESKIYIDEKLVDDENLTMHFANLDPKDLVLLENDKESKFETFVKIMDALKMLKHENFAIVTKKNEQ